MTVRTPREIPLLIRDRRLEAGMTQIELAERVGATREQVRRLEAGGARLELGLTLRARRSPGCRGRSLVPRQWPPPADHR